MAEGWMSSFESPILQYSMNPLLEYSKLETYPNFLKP